MCSLLCHDSITLTSLHADGHADGSFQKPSLDALCVPQTALSVGLGMSVKTGDQFKEEQGFKDEEEAEPMSDGAPAARGASAAAASATAGSASAQVRKLEKQS